MKNKIMILLIIILLIINGVVLYYTNDVINKKEIDNKKTIAYFYIDALENQLKYDLVVNAKKCPANINEVNKELININGVTNINLNTENCLVKDGTLELDNIKLSYTGNELR